MLYNYDIGIKETEVSFFKHYKNDKNVVNVVIIYLVLDKIVQMPYN